MGYSEGILIDICHLMNFLTEERQCLAILLIDVNHVARLRLLGEAGDGCEGHYHNKVQALHGLMNLKVLPLSEMR